MTQHIPYEIIMYIESFKFAHECRIQFKQKQKKF